MLAGFSRSFRLAPAWTSLALTLLPLSPLTLWLAARLSRSGLTWARLAAGALRWLALIALSSLASDIPVIRSIASRLTRSWLPTRVWAITLGGLVLTWLTRTWRLTPALGELLQLAAQLFDALEGLLGTLLGRSGGGLTGGLLRFLNGVGELFETTGDFLIAGGDHCSESSA